MKRAVASASTVNGGYLAHYLPHHFSLVTYPDVQFHNLYQTRCYEPLSVSSLTFPCRLQLYLLEYFRN